MGKYKYYKEERKNPFPADSGKNIWWEIESYAFRDKDEKEKNKLSPKMCEYIREKVWQSDSGHNTTLEEAYKRAQELYMKGLWSIGYIAQKEITIDNAY